MSKIERMNLLTRVFKITDEEGKVTYETVSSRTDFEEIEPRGEAWDTLQSHSVSCVLSEESLSRSHHSSTNTERTPGFFGADQVDRMLSMQSKIHKKNKEENK